MQNMEKLRSWAMRVVAGPTVRQAKQAQHWDDRKSQSRCVTRRICPRRSGRTWEERMWNRLNWEKQMTSDANRLVRPGAAAQWSPAHNGHVSVLPSGPLARGASSSGGALVRLGRLGGGLRRGPPQHITATFQYCQAALWPAGPPHRGAPWFGLSRVKGNFHARFLGGRERVNARAYPT